MCLCAFSWFTLLGRILGLKPNPWEKHHLNRARCGEGQHEAKALSETNKNGHFRRQSSIDLGAGMVHLKPEWSI